jgi:hypothetical protein
MWRSGTCREPVDTTAIPKSEKNTASGPDARPSSSLEESTAAFPAGIPAAWRPERDAGEPASAAERDIRMGAHSSRRPVGRRRRRPRSRACRTRRPSRRRRLLRQDHDHTADGGAVGTAPPSVVPGLSRRGLPRHPVGFGSPHQGIPACERRRAPSWSAKGVGNGSPPTLAAAAALTAEYPSSW